MEQPTQEQPTQEQRDAQQILELKAELYEVNTAFAKSTQNHRQCVDFLARVSTICSVPTKEQNGNVIVDVEALFKELETKYEVSVDKDNT